MNPIQTLTIYLLLIFPIIVLGASISKNAGSIQLTVYNQDFSLVKEIRDFKLNKGDNAVTLVGVAAFLEPTSVLLRPLDKNHSMEILEQNFQFDLIDYNK